MLEFRKSLWVLKLILIVALGVGWRLTGCQPPGPVLVANYCLLAVLVCACGSFALGRRWILYFAAAIAVCLAWSFFDTHYLTYFDGDSRITDTVTVWGKPNFRSVKDPNGYARGPLAGTPPQRHGHWDEEDIDFRRSHAWYWYGEKVTEREWDLRNR